VLYFPFSEATPADIGVGLTELYMTHLGYSWKMNAECLVSSLKDSHPDFLYDGKPTSGAGLVAAEASGSLIPSCRRYKMVGRAKNKYTNQVQGFVGPPQKGQSMPILHGYAIAFGHQLGTSNSWLCIHETDHTASTKAHAKANSPVPKVDGPNVSILQRAFLETFHANLFLMGYTKLRKWTGFLLGQNRRPKDEVLSFDYIEVDGTRLYVPFISLFRLQPVIPVFRRHSFFVGLNGKVFEGCLNHLSELIERPADDFENRIQIYETTFLPMPDKPNIWAQFPDGLTAFDHKVFSGRRGHSVRWSVSNGLRLA
jgi:hypothetical protein